jgi:DNA-binding CsgD family transcriptional regulator
VSGEHEVWARVAWALLDTARDIDVEPARLLAGLPFGADELRRRKRVAWTDYCSMLEYLTDVAGGFDEIEDVMAAGYHKVLPEFRMIAAAAVSPCAFARFMLDVVSPLVFPPLSVHYEELGESRVRVETMLRPGVPPCEAYFRASTGAMRGLPAHLGLPLAQMIECDVGPSHGTWEIHLPASRTIAHRARRLVMRFVLGAERDGTPVSAAIGETDADPVASRIDQAALHWKLTPRQTDVLSLVATGKANKEIAKELACADNTVELHVTRLLRKANVTSRSQLIARFWSESWGFPP